MDNKKQKTIIIGLDGADYQMVKKLMADNKLPFLSKLASKGIFAPLKSTMPPLTTPAWASMATGLNPGNHGFFDFTVFKKNSYTLKPAEYSSLTGKTIWDVFGRFGKKMAVMNFPSAFPPSLSDPFFISGVFCPEENNVYPREIAKLLKTKNYSAHPSFPFKKDRQGQFISEIKRITETEIEITLELLEKNDWDSLWIVFMAIDLMGHFFWSEETNNAQIAEFFSYLDSELEKLIVSLGENNNIIIVSDHGMKSVKGSIYINNFLEEWGFLKRKKIGFGKKLKKELFHLLLSIAERLPSFLFKAIRFLKNKIFNNSDWQEISQEINPTYDFFNDIDWQKTIVFSCGSWGKVYLNDSRFPNGKVFNEREKEAVLTEIERKLSAMVGPLGQKLVGEIFSKEKVYRGKFLESAPDLVFNSHNNDYSIYGEFGKKSFLPLKERSADHQPKGIVIATGPRIKACSFSEDKEIVDVFPSILNLNGIDIPDGIDGKPFKEISSRLETD